MKELTKDKKKALLAACHGMKSPGILMAEGKQNLME
jgi:hypothetical protein